MSLLSWAWEIVDRNARPQQPDISLEIQKSRLCVLPAELKLMVSSYLPVKALSRLGRCSRSWRQITIRDLYATNARDEQSSAIGWAIATHCMSDPVLANRVIDRSLLEGGDVNALYHYRGAYATPIHYAAAYGRHDFVVRLLQLGAHLNKWSSGTRWCRRLKRLNLTRAVTKHPFLGSYFEGFMWSPLVLPILMKDVAMINRLIEAGASPVVIASGSNGNPTNDAVTIYHMMCSIKSSKLLRSINVWGNEKFTPALDVQMAKSLNTALNLAILDDNDVMTEKLLLEGVDVNLSATSNSTPIVSAITLMLRSGTPKTKQVAMMLLVVRLIDAGADLNPQRAFMTAPLEHALHWIDVNNTDGPLAMGRDLVEILLVNGADPNRRNFVGNTIVQTACRIIRANGGNSTLERILLRLVAHGGDLNAPPPFDGKSVMCSSISQLAESHGESRQLRKILIDGGARLQVNEVPSIFQKWCQNRRLRGSNEYDIGQDKEHIPQDDINQAWKRAVLERDRSLFLSLEAREIMPSNGNDLIRQVLKYQVPTFWPAILCCPWDPNHLDESGESYLHLIVRLSHGTDNAFSPRKALLIGQKLVEMGTSTVHKNSKGKMAVDLLPKSKKRSKLYQLLLEDGTKAVDSPHESDDTKSTEES